jgi:threonylcarbamoyladenosine tRNA methylthiotransferase MtaB
MAEPSAGGVEVLTFGCRLNAWESAVMRQLALAGGCRATVIVNTCAVTSEAERQARQAIRRLRRARPDAEIVVTGCAAQIDPQRWAAMPEADRVLGNAEKLRAESWRGQDAAGPRVQAANAQSMREAEAPLLSDITGQSRAFLQVQNGCDHRCTFCVIPFGRGPSRSVAAGEVVRQAQALVDAGYREIVLSGVDLTAWGGDLPRHPTLGGLVRRLLALVPGLERLRLSSLDPAEIDDGLIALLGEDARLMPHLHLSVQSGDDLILKRMKRRHGRSDVLRLIERVRQYRPDVVFGADLIAGFPTETEAMFERTLELVETAGITWLHVFPYSPRPGTAAARMPQVPAPLRRSRAARLREAGEARAAAFLETQRGCTARVLIELDGNGRSEHFAPVRPAMALAPRSIATLRLGGVEHGRLIGEPLTGGGMSIPLGRP